MRLLIGSLCLLQLLVSLSSQDATAGPIYRLRARHRSACGIPKYDYRTSTAKFVGLVTSATAVPVVKTGQATRKTLVFDNVQAGPIILSDLAGEILGDTILVTGRAVHTGGDTGQLKGGKFRVRMECLASTGTRAANSVIVASQEYECWVRQNEPEALSLQIKCPAKGHPPITNVDRIRLVLEYHASR